MGTLATIFATVAAAATVICLEVPGRFCLSAGQACERDIQVHRRDRTLFHTGD